MKKRARGGVGEKKVALVTGGGRRIGAAIAAALGQAGYVVVPTYLASRKEAEALAAASGGTALRLDLSRPSSFPRLAARLAADFGRLDLLVHNAAIFPRTPLSTVTPAEWDAVFAINLRGPALLTRAMLPLLTRAPERPGVCFIGDAGARELWPSYLPYCLSKIALEAFAEGLRATLPPVIRVGVVRPGFVLPPPGLTESRWEQLRREKNRGIPTVLEIVRTVLHFAASKDSIY